MQKTVTDTRWLSVGTVVVALLAGIASIFLLKHRGPLIWLPFALALSAAILHTGSAVMVWRGLNSFKAELRHAYMFICIAVVFVGFTQLQLPVISIFEWWELRENGVIIIPFVLPFIFFFIGIRRFTHLLEIQTKWASAWLVNGAGVLLGVVVALLPHAPNNTDALTFGFTMVLLSWIAVQATALIAMVLKIKSRIGVRYVNAMAWLCVTYISVLLTTVAYMTTLLVASPGDWYLDYNISVAPFVIVGLLWVRAGFAFSAVTATERTPNRFGVFFGPKTHDPSPYPSVDIIIYLAEQASDIRAIDPILEDMRQVTAAIAPGQELSSEQQSQLAQVYSRIEKYLLTQDPLRIFSDEELRENIQLSFPPESLRKSFWPQLATGPITTT